MPNSQVKEAAKVLLETHTPEEVVLKLIRLRAALICHESYTAGDDIFIMDMCAYFAAIPMDYEREEDIEEPQTSAQ